MSLLQKASIVTTPTAYGVGVLNSIKPAYALGEELVVNGNFATDSDWTKGIGWTISNGIASCDGSQTTWSILGQNNILPQNGSTVKITFTISNYLAGNIYPKAGFNDPGEAINGNGTHTVYRVVNGYQEFRLQADLNFIGSIDNVSVKEVTDADFDFTRNSSATRVNPDYLIETSATNTPRLDYTNGTASILLENQSTNLIANSNFQSGWSLLSGGTITLNQAISPEGIQNAALLTGNGSASNAPYISVPVTSGTSYAFSLFVKSILSKSLRIIGFSVEAGGSAKFDLSSGVVSVAADDDLSNAKIENYGNGWYRCSVIATADGTGNALFGFESDLDINGNNFYIYGAQFEQSSFPTSIINTSGSAVTRAAESLSNAGNSSLINSTEGVLYAEIAALADDLTNRIISISDGTSNNRLLILYQVASNKIRGQFSVSGQSSKTIDHIVDTTQFRKIAFSWNSTSVKLYIDGQEIGETTTGFTFSANSLSELAFDNVSGGNFYGKCKTVAVFKEALSDTELACLTSTNNREIFLNYYYRMQYVGANTEALSCAEQTFNI